MLCQACDGDCGADPDEVRLGICARCLDHILQELTMTMNKKHAPAETWAPLVGCQLICHGGLWGIRCFRCGAFIPLDDGDPEEVDVCLQCGAEYKVRLSVQMRALRAESAA